MGCDSCSSGSCDTGSCSPDNKGLPPGMLRAYKLSTNRADGYLVWIEVVREGTKVTVSEITRRILGRIRAVNDGSRVWGVVFGHMELKPLYHEIYGLGVETLYEVHTRDLVDFHPEAYASCIAQIVIRTEPAVLLFGHSRRGVELAGRVSALLETGVVTGCCDFSVSDRSAVFSRVDLDGVTRRFKVNTYPQAATVLCDALPEVPRSEADGTVIYWQYDGSGRKAIVRE